MYEADEGAPQGSKEAFYKRIFDGLAEGVVAADEHGRPLFWNPAAESILGFAPWQYDAAEWPKRYGFFLPDRVTPVTADDMPLVAALRGETVRGELYLVHPRTRQGVWLDAWARPLHAHGRFEGAVMLFRDVTRQKLSEQASVAASFELQRSQERFRSIVMNLPGAIYRIEASGKRRPLFLSGPVREILGLPAEDFLEGRASLDALVHPADLPAVRRALDEALRDKRPYLMEYRVLLPDGSFRWVQDKGRGVFGEDGAALWFDGLFLDVTERRLAEESVLKKTAELAAADAEREQLKLFAFIASHDLRDPLQKIVSYAELHKLQCADKDDASREGAARIEQAAMRMSRLIDDILRFTRAATQKQPVEDVDLEALVAEVLSDLEVRIQKSGARVHVGKLPVLKADRVQLRQLFQNLISNAIKFAKNGEVPEVSVREQGAGGGFTVIAVSDNGIGFDDKFKERIFRPFERLHGKEEYEGSGIGLAICQKIVLRHRGKITAESTPGGGATFKVMLPLDLPDAA